MEDPRVEKLSETVKRDPENLKGWLDLGIVLSTLDRKPEAAKCFKKATDLDPNAEEAWTRFGEVLAEMGHHDKALDCFFNATKVTPDSPHAWHWLAMSYCFNQEPGKGLEAAKRAAALSPEYQGTVEWVMRAGKADPAAEAMKLIDDIVHRVADETGATILINEPRISLENGKTIVAPIEIVRIAFKGSAGPEMRANAFDRLKRTFFENGLSIHPHVE